MNMKKTELTASLSRTVNKVGLQLKKRSPEILMVAGVGIVVTILCNVPFRSTDTTEDGATGESE